MENFLKELPPPSSEKGEGKKERGPRFSENLPTLPGPLIYQPRPSRTRSESLSNHAGRLTQGGKAPDARFPFDVKNDGVRACMREASGFAAGRTREFVVGDGGGKKNLAHRGTRSLPILTTVVVLCKLDVEDDDDDSHPQRIFPNRFRIHIVASNPKCRIYKN